MSYTSLGDICQAKNGAAFVQGTQPVALPTILLSNYGGASYASPNNQLKTSTCDGRPSFKSAYSNQSSPYGSSMCGCGK